MSSRNKYRARQRKKARTKAVREVKSHARSLGLKLLTLEGLKPENVADTKALLDEVREMLPGEQGAVITSVSATGVLIETRSL